MLRMTTMLNLGIVSRGALWDQRLKDDNFLKIINLGSPMIMLVGQIITTVGEKNRRLFKKKYRREVEKDINKELNDMQ